MSASLATPVLERLTLEDWNETKRVKLEKISKSATIGEVLTTAVRAMELPLRSAFQAEFRGRTLNRTETLDEVGIENDDTLRVLPEVSAG